jgi:hypothetical protein
MLSESAEYQSDGSLRNRSVYISNSKGDRFEEISRDANDSVISKNVRLFDENNNPKELATYNAEGSLMAKMVFTYDVYGRMIEMAFCSGQFGNTFVAAPQEGEFTVLSDAAKKERLEASPCFEGYLAGRVLFKYNGKGKVTEQAEYLGDGSLVGRKVSTVDSQGNGGVLAEYDANGTLQSREFYLREFDSQMNWIKNVISKWSIKSGKYEPIEVVYRTITYH